MTTVQRPAIKPENPCFSSGPCAKRPGWSFDFLKGALLGRSHRAPCGIAKIQQMIEKSKSILGIPENYHLALVPASDTGAFEMAMWSLLGARGVDVLEWEIFGKLWVFDITQQLKLEDVRVFEAPFGSIPDLSQVDTDRDVVFVWNGTTSGVKVPDGNWIKSERKGLTLCDATSAVFAMDIPWNKLDVVTWSWQKALGGEAAHGMLALTPRAVERLESYTPPWPLPRIFRITQNGKFFSDPFEGKTINTPSMLCVEDQLDALKWAENIGGLPTLLKRSAANLKTAENWVTKTDWATFLPERPDICSSTSLCFKVIDPWFTAKSVEEQRKIIKDSEALLDKEGIAYEIANHAYAPPSYRLWGGTTMEASDIATCLEWINWAYLTIKSKE